MAMSTRCLDESTLHAVDIFILEYLAHAATSAILQDSSSTTTDRALETLDGTDVLDCQLRLDGY